MEGEAAARSTGTGIPVDTAVRTLSEDFREEIGLEGFETNRGDALGPMARVGGKVVRGAVSTVLRVAGKFARVRGD